MSWWNRAKAGKNSSETARFAGDLKNPGIQVVVSGQLAHREDLLTLSSPINKFHPDIVGDHLSSRICPAQLKSGHWIILVTHEYLTSDALSMVIETMTHGKGSFSSTGAGLPDIYEITPTLLLSLRDSGLNETEDAGKKIVTHTAHTIAFHEMVQWGVRNNASDITLNVNPDEPTSQVHFTISGLYIAPRRFLMPSNRLDEIVNVAWMNGTGGASSAFDQTLELQCRILTSVDNRPIGIRFASLAADQGYSVTLRILELESKSAARSLADLGFLPSQVAMFTRAQMSNGGSIIFSGEVGSGKSTSIKTVVEDLPPTRKLITVEDPVEYVIRNRHSGKLAIQSTVHRSLHESGEDSFQPKMKTIKRSAMNDLVLGEIRDHATGGAFIDFTGSGTTVYTSVHAHSAAHIPERLASKSIGVPADHLASPGMLNLLIHQILLPCLCQKCAISFSTLLENGGVDRDGVFQTREYWKGYADTLKLLYDTDAGAMKIRHPEGCPDCQNSEIPEINGYAGRTAAAQMIEPNTDREILRRIHANDTLGLLEHLEGKKRTAIDDSNMDNKSLMECAVYKAIIGQVDPRDVEFKTCSFATALKIKTQGAL
ncbi:Flp pilus assembly complex ATPase component TadA [Pseudomonas fluorescens]|uniref:ATPase, T2SS/T4P/T4SS family n=1 Tax=Pseudomonas fluorescens TaxID=294 RepID=UPI001930D80C|nr:ATPase, T2SS/T4P/T4SS family [Pseudomonas fluorescens]MBD8088493.1 Flp pilus assembly complex ATPase component TadA [Pseudomonas fluorescens]